MKIYAQTYSSKQIIDYSDSIKKPEGYMEMKYLQPSIDHIATPDGYWRLESSFYLQNSKSGTAK